jgi:hypothetical protein
MNLAGAIGFKSQFRSWMLFQNAKSGHVKDLKDLRCMWCRSYDANPYPSEKIDDIGGDLIWIIIYQ